MKNEAIDEDGGDKEEEELANARSLLRLKHDVSQKFRKPHPQSCVCIMMHGFIVTTD